MLPASRMQDVESAGTSSAGCPLQRTGTRHGAGWMLLISIALSLWGTGCRTTAMRHVSDPGPAIARLKAGGTIQAEVDHLVQPLVTKGGVYGMVVGVITPDGKVQTFRYGRSGRAGDMNPPGTKELFQIGSISKVFVASLLAKLVEEGQLHYEDTVRSILPPEVVVTPEVGELTLYELITHTAGFAREPITLSQLGSFLGYLATGHNLYAHLTRPYLYSYLRHCKLTPREQRGFQYSNIGIGLLAHLIEVKTGRPVTDLIVEKICRPLEMQDSVFKPDPCQKDRLAVGHTGNQACWWPRNSRMAPWEMGEIMRPSGGMYSTLEDLLCFARANLGLTRTPLESVLASTHSVRVQTPRGGEALGWIVNRFEGGSTLTFKDGMVAGYCGYLGMDLETRVAVVLLSNRFSWDDYVGHNLLLRLAGAYASGPMKTARHGRAELSSLLD